MVQLARTLFSWLAAVASPSPTDPRVLACSGSSIAFEDGAPQQRVGDIFIRVDRDANARLCRDDCGVLFREIISAEGNGVYKTIPASFAQVFPADTYDPSLHNVSVESMLPSCKDEEGALDQRLTGVKLARRSLSGLEPAAAAEDSRALTESDTPATDLAEERKKSDDYYDDYYSKSYEDDYHYEEKGACREFLDATKKFVFDMYCIIRSLDCTSYDPGADDHYSDDDKYYDDDKHHSKSGSKSRDLTPPARRLLEARSLQTEGGLPEAAAETVAVDPEPQGVASGGGSTSGSGSGSGSGSHSGSASYEDDHHDDDFYDDDWEYDNSGYNFWLILDAVWEYVGSIMAIFGWKKHEDSSSYEDDHYEDDYHKSNSKDHHLVRRGLETTTISWWDQIFPEFLSPADSKFPTSVEDWFAQEGDGSCSFTKCSGANQCFVRQQLVVDACHESLQDSLVSWEMDASCRVQDYCYASNVFGQTQCDEQFYSSLLQACPEADRSVTLSSPVPLVEGDLSDHCPLVSILLFSRMQMKSNEMYEAAQEHQSMFESTGCRRR